MSIRSLTYMVAALFLATACAETMQDSGAGQGSGGKESAKPSALSSIKPGSGRDFVVNVGNSVFFDFDKAVVRADGEETLRRQAEFLKQNPGITMTIAGHCDERGTREYNLALGERRANAARNYLISLGVSPDRLSTISYGKERPIVLGHNEAAWAQNRVGVATIRN